MGVRGADRLSRQLMALPSRLRSPIEDALLASASELNSQAIIQIQKNSGTGRTYRRGSRTHVASSPGEYPNADYGELVRKMFFRAAGTLRAVWGNSSKHALPLEKGTSRMAPRPFMRPTFLALKARIEKRISDAVNRALKDAARGR